MHRDKRKELINNPMTIIPANTEEGNVEMNAEMNTLVAVPPSGVAPRHEE
jgi:hypothetical protein